MADRAGCAGLGAILGFALFLGAVLVYWSNAGQYQDPAVAASTGRCLVLLVAGGFVFTAFVVLGAPMGRRK